MIHMDLVTILFIALGLSMDAVAVSLASGCAAGKGKVDRRQALLLAFLFGLFQTLMPVAGWLAGKAEALGGMVLIAIGLKILLEHLRGG